MRWRPGTGISTRPPRTAMRRAWGRRSRPVESRAGVSSSPPNRVTGSHATAAQAFEASRRALGVDVIDMYLIHWPVPSQGLFVEVWNVLEQIYAAGGARVIGVSNFKTEHLDTLLANTTVVPAVNQVELHPTFQQAALSAKARALGIAVEAYSPLGQGADLNEPAVTALATERGVTPAQVVLGWHLGLGNIVIPKSIHPHRIRENLAAAEVTLSRGDLDAITALEAGARIGTDPAKPRSVSWWVAREGRMWLSLDRPWWLRWIGRPTLRGALAAD
jgi:diketogulonate reductase-like aldo/keto reductase